VSSSTDSSRLASRLGAVASLAGLYLQDLTWRVDHRADDATPGVSVSPNVDIRSGTPSHTTLGYVISGSVEAAFADDESLLFSLHATYVVGFTIPDVEFASDEIQRFGLVTAVPIVFPYLRALVTDMTARGGVPPLVLDLLKIPFGSQEAPPDPGMAALSAELPLPPEPLDDPFAEPEA
jgi:preprotein translocase subunit SecB